MCQIILEVEDEPSLRELVAEVLGMVGYSVETAVNGQEALEKIERTHPALILLDMRMPVLDGWGVARKLRERGNQIPIVVMTAAQSAQRWAEEIGADGFLGKPFEIDDLIDIVGRFTP